MLSLLPMVSAILGMVAADTTPCERAVVSLVNEDACGDENGPSASKACAHACKPLACAVVTACSPGSTVRIEDETGTEIISAERVQSFVQELAAEDAFCPCSTSLRQPNGTIGVQKTVQAATSRQTACEKALLELMSEDACGNENGPDASKACSDTCKPLACAVVTACTAGSTVRVKDETGSWTIPTGGVHSIVQESWLSSDWLLGV